MCHRHLYICLRYRIPTCNVSRWTLHLEQTASIVSLAALLNEYLEEFSALAMLLHNVLVGSHEASFTYATSLAELLDSLQQFWTSEPRYKLFHNSPEHISEQYKLRNNIASVKTAHRHFCASGHVAHVAS